MDEPSNHDRQLTEDRPVRKQRHWLSSAVLVFVLAAGPIYWGAYHTLHHRYARGLPELIAGLAVITLIATGRRLLGPEFEDTSKELALDNLQSGRSLGMRRKWFRRIPSDEWRPPSWSEILRLGSVVALAGAYPALSGVNQLFFIGYSSHHFYSYFFSLLFFVAGVLIWSLLPLLVWRKVRAPSNRRKRETQR